MRLSTLSIVVAAAAAAQVVNASPARSDDCFVKAAGDAAAIKGWYMQSTADTSSDMLAVSQPGFDVSSWYRVGSRGTVMVCVNRNSILSSISKTGKAANRLNAGWAPRE